MSNVVNLFKQEPKHSDGDGDADVVRIIVEGSPEQVDEYLARFYVYQGDDMPEPVPESKPKRGWLWFLLGVILGFGFGG